MTQPATTTALLSTGASNATNAPEQNVERSAQISRARQRTFPQDARMTFNKNIGMILLAVYLILVGLIALTGLPFGILPAIVALIAGIFILIGR